MIPYAQMTYQFIICSYAKSLLFLIVLFILSSLIIVQQYYNTGPPTDFDVKINQNACFFFRSPKDKCNMTEVDKFAEDAFNNGGCIPKEIKRFRTSDLLPPSSSPSNSEYLLFHQWVTGTDWSDEVVVQKTLVSLKAFLLSQNLANCRLIFWMPSSDLDVLRKSNVTFFEQHSSFIILKEFSYHNEIKNTPLSQSSFFVNITKVHKLPIPTYSDIVRNLLLFKYGCVWLDNDSVPLKDLWFITYGVGYQFTAAHKPSSFPRTHSNNHVLFSYAQSPLSMDILEAISRFPYDDPQSWPHKPYTGLLHWVYNDALSHYLRSKLDIDFPGFMNKAELTLEEINTIVPLTQFWYPMEWLDPTWATSCLRSSWTAEELLCGGFFIWHSRYSRANADKSKLDVVTLLEKYWKQGLKESSQDLGGTLCRQLKEEKM